MQLAVSGPELTPNDPFFDMPGIVYDAGGDYDQTVLAQTYLINVQGKPMGPLNIALRINAKFYVCPVQSTDTSATIAAALAALVVVDIVGTRASGSLLIIGPTGRLQAARVGGFGTTAREIKRQERVVQVIVWANSPDVRDALAAALDVAISERQFMEMPDTFGARVIYKNTMLIDGLQKDALYRRDLNYTVEYATTVSKQRAQVIAPSATVNEIVVTA